MAAEKTVEPERRIRSQWKHLVVRPLESGLNRASWLLLRATQSLLQKILSLLLCNIHVLSTAILSLQILLPGDLDSF